MAEHIDFIKGLTDKAFYRGILSVLAIIYEVDDRDLYERVINSIDLDKLLAAAEPEHLDLCGLEFYGYTQIYGDQ